MINRNAPNGKTYQIGKQELTLAKPTPKRLSLMLQMMGLQSFTQLLEGDNEGRRERAALYCMDIQLDQAKFDRFLATICEGIGDQILLDDIEDSRPVLEMWLDFFWQYVPR